MGKQTVEIDIPDGWEFVSVREPVCGEFVLSSYGVDEYPTRTLRVVVRRKLLEGWVNVYDDGSRSTAFETPGDARRARYSAGGRTVHMREVVDDE